MPNKTDTSSKQKLFKLMRRKLNRDNIHIRTETFDELLDQLSIDELTIDEQKAIHCYLDNVQVIIEEIEFEKQQLLLDISILLA